MKRCEKAVLASFILLPLERHEKGRRAAEIVRTAPFAFSQLFYKTDRLVLALAVSAICRRMVKIGLLEISGRVPHKFELPVARHPRGMMTNVYDSPQYRLTEAGFCLALSWKWHRMPDLKKRKKRKDAHAFAIERYEAQRAFLKSF